MSDENHEQEYDKLVVGVTLFSAILSTFGSILILSTYIFFKKIRNYAFKLILYLSISDLVLTVGELLSIFTFESHDHDFLCTLQSYMLSIGGLSSIIWTSVIAWNIYSATVKGAKKKDTKSKKFLFVGYCIPALVSLIPWIAGAYGKTRFRCWIRPREDSGIDTFFIFMMFYIPLLLALGFNIYSYIKVVKFFKKYTQSSQSEMRFVHRLKYYPLVLVFCWSLGTATAIYNLFNEESYTLMVISYGLGGLQGFMNAMIYGMNKQVKSIWREKFFKCCQKAKVIESIIKSGTDRDLEKESDSRAAVPSRQKSKDEFVGKHVELEESDRGDNSVIENSESAKGDVNYDQ